MIYRFLIILLKQELLCPFISKFQYLEKFYFSQYAWEGHDFVRLTWNLHITECAKMKEEACDGKKQRIRDETKRRGRKKAVDTSKIDIDIIVRLKVPHQASVWSSDTGRQDLSAP